MTPPPYDLPLCRGATWSAGPPAAGGECLRQSEAGSSTPLASRRRLRQQRTLAFCISTRHCRFCGPASSSKAGVRAIAVYGLRQGDKPPRATGRRRSFAISSSPVGRFGEGADLLAIDTVLMLRPHRVARIVFLQTASWAGLALYQGKRTPGGDRSGGQSAGQCPCKPQLLQTQIDPPTNARNRADTARRRQVVYQSGSRCCLLLALLKKQQETDSD